MPVLPLDCHLPTQYTTHTITLQQWTNNKTNKSYKQLIYIYIHISCKYDTNRAGHFTLDAHASIPVACFPFDITISLSWFPLLSLHYNPLYYRGRETSSWFRAVTGRHFSNPKNTNVSWRLPNLHPESYDWGLPDHGPVDWPRGLTSWDQPRGLAGVQRSGHELFPWINKKLLNMTRILIRTWQYEKTPLQLV